MSLILDTGALLSVERNDRDVLALLKAQILARRIPLTHGGVVGQVWRGGSRHAAVARLLRAVTIAALDEDLGRRAGLLLGRARRTDVVDAAIVSLAVDGDWILTSDPDDLRALAKAAGTHVELIPV